ncbi:MAG: transposase [Verrucomicrobiae bacterium]|nr:transposase [Verrucomicrobiae bacterium]
MTRHLRIEYEHATHHVMARGNRRESIHTDDADRETFFARLGTECQKTGGEVWAFVLMSNHCRFILHTPPPHLVDEIDKRVSKCLHPLFQPPPPTTASATALRRSRPKKSPRPGRNSPP